MTRPRDLRIDLMRAFACLMVIICHSPQEYANQGGQWLIGVVTYFGMAWGPILFFLISGACILDGERDAIPFLKKRFSRILCPTVIWSIVYILLESFCWKTAPIDGWYRKIPYILVEPQYGLFWFMYALIAIYLIAPIFSRWLNRCSKNEIQVYLLIWSITLILPYLKIWDIDLTGRLTYLTYNSGFLWCAVLGFYCKKFVKIERLKVWHIVICLLVLLSPLIIYFIKRYLGKTINSSMSLLPMLATAMAFIFIYNVKLPKNLTKGTLFSFINLVSRLSFGIYLTHMLFLHPFNNWIRQFNLNYAIQIPITVLVIGGLSLGFSWIISKLPFGRFLIG